MIEKKIHYCWFGGNPLDALAEKCLESWRKYFPDYEIIKWDESNFDVNQMEFMSQAYKNGKWAFVSDVARLIVVYEHGGLYFDTDVEVIKSYDDILNESQTAFFGMEKNAYVSSGLGFGAVKGHPFLKELIDEYDNLNFENNQNNLANIACPIITNKKVEEKGFVFSSEKQKLDDINIYPAEFFAPIDFETGKLNVTEKTHSIHWYGMSWITEGEKKDKARLQKLRKIFGKKYGAIIFDFYSYIKKEGLFNYLRNRNKRRK